MNDKYRDYLKSDIWKEKRDMVFTKKGRKCEKCFSEHNLAIHHWTYRRIYNETLSDLFVLCNNCHYELHEIFWTRDLLRATKAFIKWEEYIPRKRKPRKTKEERRALRAERKKDLFPKAIEAIKNWLTYKQSWIWYINIWRKAIRELKLK